MHNGVHLKMKLIKTSLITSLLLLFIACGSSDSSSDKTNPTMTQADYQKSHNNFSKSLELNNRFTSWMNELAQASSQRPSEETWLYNLGFLKQAIDHAKEVHPQYLAVHPGLQSNWEQLYIPSMEGIYSYYSESLKNTNTLSNSQLNQNYNKLKSILDLDERWAYWFEGKHRQITLKHYSILAHCFKNEPNKEQCPLHKNYKNN